MRVHDVTTFKAMQFAPLLNSLREEFLGDLWPNTEPGRQAVHEDFANGVIKVTHSLRSNKFVLWVCNELSLDLVQRYQDATYNPQAFSFVKRGTREAVQVAHQ